MTRHFLILIAAMVLAAGVFARAGTVDDPAVKSTVLQNDLVYLQVGEVDKNLAAAINSALSTSTNPIIGTILDLRFAGGNDADAVKPVADLLTAKKSPLAILVNGETRGAADKLALDLRTARAGLVFGRATADLQPDIAVTVSAAVEKEFRQNPYLVLPQNENNSIVSTNRSGFLVTNNFSVLVDHTSEADLVRAKVKDGSDEDEALPIARPAPPRPVIRDPVLARAADFLKALAVLPVPRG